MVAFMSFVIFCGFAVLQGYGQKPVSLAEELNANIPSADLKAGVASIENSPINAEASGNSESQSSSSEESQRTRQARSLKEQYDIISQCTNVPALYTNILQTYLSSENVIDVQDIQKRLDDLKSRIQQLFKDVDTYSKALNLPDLSSVRNQMVSSVEALLRSVDTLRQNIIDNPQLETANRITFAQNNVRPALVDFQTACLDETKFIVNNVLTDLKDNSKASL